MEAIDRLRCEACIKRADEIMHSTIFQPQAAQEFGVLNRGAFIELMICMAELLETLDAYGKRVSFTDDVIAGKNKVKDVTDLIVTMRNACCHVSSQLKEARDAYWVDYYVIFGELRSTRVPGAVNDYQNDIAVFFGTHRLYHDRHIVEALFAAEKALKELKENPAPRHVQKTVKKDKALSRPNRPVPLSARDHETCIKNLDHCKKLIKSHIFEKPNQDHVLNRSAFIDLIICISDVAVKLNRSGQRVVFDPDIDTIKNDAVRDVTDLLNVVRNAACHFYSEDAKTEDELSLLNYYRVYGKLDATLLNGLPIEAPYEDELTMYFGRNRLFMNRHVQDVMAYAYRRLALSGTSVTYSQGQAKK